MIDDPSDRYVFISYVREDADAVDRLEARLATAGVSTWRDTHGIAPGTRWRDEIRSAIREGKSFIACFSANSEHKDRSYMREEVLLAIEELRLRPRNRAWFFPVKLSPCEIPDVPIGPGERLSDIQHLELFEVSDEKVLALAHALRSAVGRIYPIVVSDWSPFNWRAIEPVAPISMAFRGGTLFLEAPHGNYGGLYGAASTEEISDNIISGSARISCSDPETGGYGLAIVPRGHLAAGAPVGWSLQIEWDPPYGQFQARAVTLPPGAWFGPTPEHRAIPVPISASTWFDFEFRLHGPSVTVAVAGVELPPMIMPENRGAPLVRVWGGEAAVRQMTIRPPD